MKRGDARLQKIILRLMALVGAPALPAVIAPKVAVEKLSWWLGFGEPPHVPLIYYLAAGGSVVYVIFSMLLWVLSLDVVRYRPLVVFVGIASAVAGPIYAWVDASAGMPLWWVLMDALTCVVAGLALLWALGPQGKPGR